MQHEHGGRDLSRMVLGGTLVALGLLLTLDRLGVLDAGNWTSYWPLLLVAVGLAKAMQPPGTPGRGFGLGLIVFGVLLLLSNLDLIPYSIWDFWPLLLVFLGISLLLRATGLRWHGTAPPPPPRLPLDQGFEEGPEPEGTPQATSSGPERVFATAILGGVERRVASPDFRGGSLTAVMGSCEVDLRQAAIAASPAVIDVFAMWGGIELRVPPEWTVRVEGTPVMGAIEDHTAPGRSNPQQVLIIRGSAIMGGVEIKN